VIAIAVIILSSSASGTDADSGVASKSLPATAAPEKCPGIVTALRFYTERWRHWTSLRVGAGRVHLEIPAGGNHPADPVVQACPRYLLKIRQRKALAAHREWNRWFRYQYAWSEWLPDKWQRIGACETGYGRRPGNWRHSNSSYEGAFGFAKQSWDSFKYRADPKAGPYPEDAWQATPRQQYEVALAIWRRYGFSGWGCRGA